MCPTNPHQFIANIELNLEEMWACEPYQGRARCHGPRTGPRTGGASRATTPRSRPHRSRTPSSSPPPCLWVGRLRLELGKIYYRTPLCLLKVFASNAIKSCIFGGEISESGIKYEHLSGFWTQFTCLSEFDPRLTYCFILGVFHLFSQFCLFSHFFFFPSPPEIPTLPLPLGTLSPHD
jgi:hypothetical protein